MSLPDTEGEFDSLLTGDSLRTWGDGRLAITGLGQQGCRADDLMTLRNDNTYSYSNGSILCGEDILNQTGIWDANFADLTITFDRGSSNEITATIIGLTDSTLALRGVFQGLEITGEFNLQ